MREPATLAAAEAPRKGRIATILLGPDVRQGVHLQRDYTQYSLLATLEDRFGLPRLWHARDARGFHRRLTSIID
jgi:hypothetical protein